MKRILMITILLLFCVAIYPIVAAERSFEWDANTDVISGYKAYRSISPDVKKIAANYWLTLWPPDLASIPSGANHIRYNFTDDTKTVCTITVDVIPPGLYYFVWTAFNPDEEGKISNEVNTTVYQVPADVVGLRCFKP